MPACCAVLQDDSTASACTDTERAQQQQQPAGEPAASSCADSDLSQQQQSQPTAAEPAAQRHTRKKAVAAAAAPSTGHNPAQAWGVMMGLLSIMWPVLLVLQGTQQAAKRTRFGRALLHILAMLFQALSVILTPATWLICKAGEYLGRGWVHCAVMGATAMPWACDTYLKLGKRGRYIAPDGKTYIKAVGPGGITNSKFRVIQTHKQVFTWGFARRVLPARALMLFLMLMLTCLSSTAAMHMHHSATAPSNPTRWALQQLTPLSPPYTTFPLLAAELSDDQAGFFR
jgi:hypothetical protein